MTERNWMDLAGGVGLFLYGMLLMTSSMEQAASGPLRRVLTRATRTLPRAILAGMLITGLIQSSGATALLCIGLAGAGLLPLSGAAGVMLGANIGTTVTAQLLALGGGSAARYSPALCAPLFCLAGAVLCLACRRGPAGAAGQILLGFGLLFSGLSGVRQAVAPLGQSPLFLKMLAQLGHPLPGVLAGAVSSAVLQSSSAAVGLLQALAATGMVRWTSVVPLVLGQNIGACITPLFAAHTGPGGQAAVACARFNLLFNLLGSALCLTGFYLAVQLFPALIDAGATGAGIANFHSLFNLGAVLLLAPFTRPLLRLTAGKACPCPAFTGPCGSAAPSSQP